MRRLRGGNSGAGPQAIRASGGATVRTHQVVERLHARHGLLDALLEAAHPVHRPRARRRVERRGGRVLLRVEDVVHHIHLLAVRAHQVHVLLLQIRRNQLAVQQALLQGGCGVSF
eukprot:7336879-Pyramimonas_sp.AAC.2